MSRRIRSRRAPTPSESYIDALLKAHVILTREEARALYDRLKDASLPNDDYDVALRAVRKLGEAA